MSTQPTNRELAHSLVDALARAGTTHAFGVPGGGSNLDVVGAAIDSGIQFVLTHTENAAAIMAGVVGELTGAPGVCIATRGPGAASAVNGAAQALLDRQPMVLVTDCVAHADHARVSHQRLDQPALMAPVTKASARLSLSAHAADIVALATAGRPGPVHVDIDASHPAEPPPETGAATTATDIEWHDMLRSARRPVVVVGVGAVVVSPAVRRCLSEV
ncbi:MAG: hypothetical protein RI900_1085, partial [Actinomycetota bacterium]